MAPTGANPAPAPAPPPFVLGPQIQATPVLGPPVGSATCATPDPFTSLGGGICSNGGWLPPGSQVPTAGSSSPTGSLGPTPAPVGNAFCLGPDPFASLPGYRGVCAGGGWIPRPIGGN
jgi:hypothetical protein